MIPLFPDFKPLELSDKCEIEKYTSLFPPYSNFNFVSLWSWNIQKDVKISTLNNNLVVIFSDYLTGQPFISFIGCNMALETSQILFDYSVNNYKVTCLKLLPEFLALTLGNNGWNIKADAASHDYVLSIEKLITMNKWSKSKISKNIKRFQKENPNYIVIEEKINSVEIVKYINLFETWANCKNESMFSNYEYEAFKRYIHMASSNVFILSIFVSEKLIGFETYEIVSTEYAISHFSKSDFRYKGINEMLQWEEAKHLSKLGIKYLNIEEDLGLEGLRFAKQKYRPVHFFKKYVIEKNTSPSYLIHSN